MPNTSNDQLEAAKVALLDVLASGAVESDSGRATSVLAETIDMDGWVTNQALAQMELEGKVVRDVRGRRTYSVRLPINGETAQTIRHAALARNAELAAGIAERRAQRDEQSAAQRAAQRITEAAAATAEHPSNGHLKVVEPVEKLEPSEPELFVDVEAVAAALLRQVIDMTTAPKRVDQAKETMERDFAATRIRLADAVEEAQRLRKQLRAAQDHNAALQMDCEGLRARAQHAEANLNRALHTPPLDLAREHELRELAKTMQTKPGAYAGNKSDAH